MFKKVLSVGDLLAYVASKGACIEARQWLGEFDVNKPAAEVYAVCANFNWLWWLYKVIDLDRTTSFEVDRHWFIFQEARDRAFWGLVDGDRESEVMYGVAVNRAELIYLASRLDWRIVEAAIRKELESND